MGNLWASRPAGGGLGRRSSLQSGENRDRIVKLSPYVSVLVLFFAVFLSYAPVFTLSMLVLLAVVLVFIMTERSKTHDAIEFQNRFWSFWVFLFAWICVFIRDSPLRFSSKYNGLGWFVVFASAFAAHNLDRYIRRQELKKIPQLPRINSGGFNEEFKSTANKKIAEINVRTAVIDDPYVSSTFQNIFNIFRVMHAEQSIIAIFKEATKVSKLFFRYVELLAQPLTLELSSPPPKRHSGRAQLHDALRALGTDFLQDEGSQMVEVPLPLRVVAGLVQGPRARAQRTLQGVSAQWHTESHRDGQRVV